MQLIVFQLVISLLSVCACASFQPVDDQTFSHTESAVDYTNPSSNHLELESLTRHILHTLFSRQYTNSQSSLDDSLKPYFTHAAYEDLSKQLSSDPLLTFALKHQAVTTETFKRVNIRSLDSLMHPQWEVTIDFDLFLIKSSTEIKRSMSAVFQIEPADPMTKLANFSISSVAIQSVAEPTVINHESERLKDCHHIQ